MNKSEIEPCCLTCKHFGLCPLIVKWVELTEAPIEAVKFYCSEYKIVALKAGVS